MVFTMSSLPPPLRLNSAHYFVKALPCLFAFAAMTSLLFLAQEQIFMWVTSLKPPRKTLLFSEVKLKGIMSFIDSGILKVY